jgi:hypothetical protein
MVFLPTYGRVCFSKTSRLDHIKLSNETFEFEKKCSACSVIESRIIESAVYCFQMLFAQT